jgi:hypothetical protein
MSATAAELTAEPVDDGGIPSPCGRKGCARLMTEVTDEIHREHRLRCWRWSCPRCRDNGWTYQTTGDAGGPGRPAGD